MMYLVSPSGRLICTNSTPEIDRIIVKDGHYWFDALNPNKPLKLSEEAFNKIDIIISP